MKNDGASDSNSSNQSTAEAPDRLTKDGRRALVAAVTGTVIEWYDYALYGAAAGLVIGPLFFENASIGSQLAAFATFAVGFVSRPLGGILVGHIGDKYGRRPALMLSVILMGVATVGIGLLPTEAAIGLAAPLLLVLFRMIQGLGAGAELAGAMTLVAEFAPRNKRGLLTAIVLSSPPAGIVLATGAFLIASSFGDEILLGGAWRVPFLVSALLFFVALFIRKHLEETPEYVAAMEERAQREKELKLPLGQLLRRRKKEVAVGFFSMTGHNALNYTMAVFALSLMTSDAVGLQRTEALTAVMIGTMCAIFTTPFGGMLADRFGAGTILATGSLLGAIFAFPLLAGLTSGNATIATVVIALGYGGIIALTSGGQGAFIANLFPPEERYSGTALAREFNGALVAGFTPLVMAWVMQETNNHIGLSGAALALPLLSSVVAIAWWQRTHAANQLAY